jgi:hypothetical protein
LTTAKLLLEQVLTHFKKPKAKKKVAFVVDDDGVPPGVVSDVDTDAEGMHLSSASDIDIDNKAKESSDDGLDSDQGKQGDRSGRTSDDDGSGGTKADEMESTSTTGSVRQPLRIDGEDEEDDSFLIDGSQGISLLCRTRVSLSAMLISVLRPHSPHAESFTLKTNRPLIPSSPMDGTMLSVRARFSLRRLLVAAR